MSTRLGEVLHRPETPIQPTKALKTKASNLNNIKALVFNIKTRLCDNSIGNDKFYYKVAWHLTESQINNILERCVKADSPIRYFLKAASVELRQG